MIESENKAVFRRFYEEIWNGGDLAAADELLSEDFVTHEVEGTPYPHRELYKEGVVETRTAYPDWTLVIEDLVAEGDRVTARWRAWGTHTGEVRGVAPSGKRDEFVGTTVVRVAGGKIVEFSKQQSEVLDG
ncbi:MAG: hypothetical protein AVDCRST_MAG58-2771 [uncultured Rubrobacteraceae bacterium]|uniref:Ester cyclase n=1 Tax=uncultured Rubrobacteraceae bacterium TaxID=349277 RepID=A0A6J4RA83_9ACTN|nr:MAG: hypothetical protein AVDCRST_MAG58-2771 [uncultured Rubrobacteraceae bacterium]